MNRFDELVSGTIGTVIEKGLTVDVNSVVSLMEKCLKLEIWKMILISFWTKTELKT